MYLAQRVSNLNLRVAATPAAAYCYIGMRASYTYLISRYLGYDAKFYDPSWAEWGRLSELPLTAGASRR